MDSNALSQIPNQEPEDDSTDTIKYSLNGPRKSRARRSLAELLLMPNTKWCGVGYSATTYADLGGASDADHCCRQHDMRCPFYIQGFQRKYGYFNFGLSTISHCSCDQR